MPDQPSSKLLAAKNLDLRARLDKAEATLREVLSGEADAMFITGTGGAQLFTLTGADQSYRTLIENMSEGALTLTPEGLILYANLRFAEMLRSPLEKVIGSEIHRWFAPKSRQAIQALLQKEVINNYREELDLTAADGTQIPVYLSVSRLVLNETHDSVCMVVTDLTKQKRTEAILAAEKLSNAILEQAADAIVICDKNGRIIRASKQVHAFYGKSPLGQPFAHAFPLRHMDGTAFSSIDAINSQLVETMLNCHGQECHLLVSVGHLRDEREELLGSVVTLTDITELKMGELALKKSEQQLSEALTVARIGYWEYEYSTDEFIFNDQYYLLHRMTAEDAGGYRMSSTDFASRYVYHDDAPMVAQQVRLAFESRDPNYTARIETRILSGKGEIIWVEVRFRVKKDALGNTIHLLGINQDITERKKSEEEIKFKNTILRTQQEASPDAILLVDENANIISYNQQFIDMWQVSPQIVSAGLDAPVLKAVADQVEDPGAFIARIQYLYEHRDKKSHEEIPLKNGRILDRYSAPVTGADGKYYGRVWYFRNITERKHAELALRKSELRFKTMFEQAPLGIALINSLNGRIHEVNPRFAEIAGRSVEEMINIDWVQITHPDDVQADLDNMALLNSGKVSGFNMEKRYLRPDGTNLWVNMTVSPLKAEDKADPRHLCMIQDITERKKMALELQESERRFSDMLSNVDLVSLMLDTEARITYCNEYLLRLTGWQREEVIGKSWWEIFMPPELNELKDTLFTSLLDPHPKALHYENEILTRTGERRLIRWNNSVLRSIAGEAVGTASIGEDITERINAEASIKYLNRVLSVLSGINTLIVRVKGREELFTEACNIATEAGGFRMAMIVIVEQNTMFPVSITSAGKDDELLADIRKALSSSESMQKTMIAEAISVKKAVISNDTQNDPRLLSGIHYAAAGVNSMTVLPLIISSEAVGVFALYASEINFFQEDEMKLLTELASDIAYAIDHIDKQERLNYLAYYDVLTGLANRTLFLERAAQYVRSAGHSEHKLALGMIDLERFKNINDSLGRPAGDGLLKQVAEWLTQFSQDASLLARIDADHFSFVVPEVKSDGNLAMLVESLMSAFQEHSFNLNDATFRISIKVGIAVFPDDGDNVDTLYTNAEAALKKAKLGGQRYLFYTARMTEAVTDKLRLENQLRKAIDNDEFVLHYQPKVNLMSGKVTSAEALIRWNDPITGLVPPGRFIPILEETGLIFEVGRWALRQAVTDSLRWRKAGLSAVRIAVNMSPLQLHNLNFLDELKEILSIDTNAAAGLELEITESLIMQDIEHSTTRLNDIRALGITIAIDDFGTGFSSLSYLAKLPVNTLKIDRSFVIEMDQSSGMALVATIIMMAHALNLKVVAEGVESEQQMRQLLSLHCDEMQGFLFSKPVPAEIFEARFLVPCNTHNDAFRAPERR